MRPGWGGVDRVRSLLCSENIRTTLRGLQRETLDVSGLIFHDLRRTAARNLRRAGIAEGVIMKIGGWKTRSVFERYAIVNRTDIVDAMKKLQQAEKAIEAATVTISHELGHAAKRTDVQAIPALPH